MSRKAFEAWWEKEGQFCRAGGFYLLQHANTSWIAWQAATAAALEEAAKASRNASRQTSARAEGSPR